MQGVFVAAVVFNPRLIKAAVEDQAAAGAEDEFYVAAGRRPGSGLRGPEPVAVHVPGARLEEDAAVGAAGGAGRSHTAAEDLIATALTVFEPIMGWKLPCIMH